MLNSCVGLVGANCYICQEEEDKQRRPKKKTKEGINKTNISDTHFILIKNIKIITSQDVEQCGADESR